MKNENQPSSDLELGRYNLNPSDVKFIELIIEDFKTHDRDFFNPGFLAIAVHRFGNLRMDIKSKLLRMPFSLLYKILFKFILHVCGISLAYTVKLGRRVRIWHHGGIVLGAISIGDDVQIRHNVTFGVKKSGDPRWLKPVIENNCEIGTGAVIVGNITVGENSFIGANVILSQDLPANSVAKISSDSIIITTKK